jgi:hypothetical protein
MTQLRFSAGCWNAHDGRDALGPRSTEKCGAATDQQPDWRAALRGNEAWFLAGDHEVAGGMGRVWRSLL